MAVLQLSQDQAFEQMIVSEALKDLGDLWKLIPDPTNGAEVKSVVTEYLPTLIHTYGEPIAVKAAERFEEIRSLAGVSGRYFALLAEAPEQDRINSHAKRLLAPIFRDLEGNPDEALRNLEGLTSRMVLEQGRKTTVENTFSKRSGADGFVRVPSRTDTCGFCLIMATKVYKTAQNAGEGNRFHNRCHCSVVPKYEAVAIDGYDPQDLERRYKEAFKNSDGSLNEISKKIKL